MKKINFIPDEEINLNDKDLLETKRYANTIKEMILSSREGYTIGLFGKWGTGKSSIVKTVKEELEHKKDKGNQKFKFIVYDAWKYSGDSFKKIFLLKLQNFLNPDDLDENYDLYQDKTVEITDKEFTIKSIIKNIVTLALIPVMLLVSIYYLLKLIGIELNITLGDVTIFTLIPIVILIVYKVIDNSSNIYKKTIKHNKFFAPEQFEHSIKELLNKLLNGNSSDLLISGKFDKIVIVIDNIDRCDSEKSYELLTNVKNFLSNQNGVILLVPIDDELLMKNLIIRNNINEENINSSIKESKEFLDRFFNVAINIKYFKDIDLFTYINKLNMIYSLGLNPHTVDIIAKEYAANPRRIIKILNNLMVELKFVESKTSNRFVENNQSLITILLIIREEWLDLYSRIGNYPYKIKQLKYYIGDEQQIFFHRVGRIIEQSDIFIVEKIIRNIDSASLVSQELIDLINNLDYVNLNIYLNNNPEFFDDMIIYLIEEFNKELQRGTFNTSAVKIFETILEVHNIRELNSSQLTKIRSVFDLNSFEVIDNINPDKLDYFFQFMASNNKFGLDYLLKLSYDKFYQLWSVEYLLSQNFRSKFDNYSYIWIYGLESFINNLNDDFIRNKLGTLYTTYYKFHCDNRTVNYLYGKNNKETIKKNKLKSLEIENIITFIIDGIDIAFINENNIIYLNDFYKELHYLFNNELVSAGELIPSFDKSNLDIPRFNNFDNIDSLCEAIDQLILYITKLLEKTPKSGIYGCPILIQELILFLFKHHKIYDDGGVSTNFLYTDIIKNNKNYLRNMVNFFIETCRVLFSHIHIYSPIRDLVNNNSDIREMFYEGLLRLNVVENINFMKKFESDLFAKTEYTDNLLYIYEFFFLDEGKNISIISNKIRDILVYILENNDNKKLVKFMKARYKNEELKDMINLQLINFARKDIKKLLRLIR